MYKILQNGAINNFKYCELKIFFMTLAIEYLIVPEYTTHLVLHF